MFKKKGGRKSKKDGRDDALVVHAQKPKYVSVGQAQSNQNIKLKDDQTLATLATHEAVLEPNFFTTCIGHTLVASLDQGLDGIDSFFFSGFACDEKNHVPPLNNVVVVRGRSDNSILSGDDSVITGVTFCGERSYSGLITAGHPDDEITELENFVPANMDSRNPRSDSRPVPGRILTIQYLEEQSRDKPDPDEQRDGRTHPPFRDFSKEYTPAHQGQVRVKSIRFMDEVDTEPPIPPLQKLLCYKHCLKTSPASGVRRHGQKTAEPVKTLPQRNIKIISSS